MTLDQFLPNLRYPIICSPMANVSGWELALSVSQAGGLGLIGGGYSIDKLRSDITAALKHRKNNEQIGFGILTFTIKDQSAIHQLLSDFEESQMISCIWLFGGSEEAWISSLKQTFPKLAIIVQVHTVHAATAMVEAGADVLVAQGSDAGGHGGAESSSLLTLVPELIQACPNTPIVAAGGISNGQTMYAALALGAQAVVLGTRFMLSQESVLPEAAKQVALKTRDGGKTTVQTRVYDEARGTTDWPMQYTGRAIRNLTIKESIEGRDQEALIADYKSAMETGDYGRLVCWAGTGIGLINDILPASEIVKRLVSEYNQAVNQAPQRIE